MPGRPDDTTVLILDCQATRANPDRGHLLEIGWAVAGPETVPEAVASHLLRLPPDAVVPEPVRRITGIVAADSKGTVSEPLAWKRLSKTAAQVAACNRSPLCPTVIHFAAFEKPYLLDLHARFGGAAPFPLEILCTHALARRLLPGLPRKSLRAVAGYFGHPLGAHHRSRDHVLATAAVWRHLARLAGAQGISDWEALRAYTAQPSAPRSRARTYPMNADCLGALEDRPGVYRMLGRHGNLLYVGKAASLRKRVGGYFRPRALALPALGVVHFVADPGRGHRSVPDPGVEPGPGPLGGGAARGRTATGPAGGRAHPPPAPEGLRHRDLRPAAGADHGASTAGGGRPGGSGALRAAPAAGGCRAERADALGLRVFPAEAPRRGGHRPGPPQAFAP
jgi:DNA polymerase III epsilon subunit-like protein